MLWGDQDPFMTIVDNVKPIERDCWSTYYAVGLRYQIDLLDVDFLIEEEARFYDEDISLYRIGSTHEYIRDKNKK